MVAGSLASLGRIHRLHAWRATVNSLPKPMPEMPTVMVFTWRGNILKTASNFNQEIKIDSMEALGTVQ
jgi:hypothetical protein